MNTRFLTPEISPRSVSYKELISYLNGATAHSVGTIPTVWQYLSRSQRRTFMKQIIWTALFQIIDLLQVLFKDFVIEKSKPSADVISNVERVKKSNIT